MKLAILLPGYLDSPDYLHIKTFEKHLKDSGYHVERLDPCNVWSKNNVKNYSVTNHIEQVRQTIEQYKNKKPEEIILIGHSLGAFVSIISGNRINQVTKIVALCPPPEFASEAKWKDGYRHSERDLPEDPEKHRSFDIPISFIKDAKQYSATNEAKQITKPLMIFVGLNDDIVPPSQTEQIVNNAKNPFVVRQPNMGHNFRASKEQTEIVWNHIQKFLNTEN